MSDQPKNFAPAELVAGKEMKKTVVLPKLAMMHQLHSSGALNDEVVKSSLAGHLFFINEITDKDLKLYGIKDKDSFLEFGQVFEVLTDFDRPAGTGGGASAITSRERAIEVLNDDQKDSEESITKVMATMTHIKQLAKSIEPLINQKAVVSIALKNLKADTEEPAPAEAVADSAE